MTAPTEAEVEAREQAAADRAPDLLYSETETDLRDSVRSLLAARARPEDVLPRADGSNDGGPGADTALWHALAADLGCASLLVPEDDDGAGASFREAATVAEELGRSVAPVPYLGSAIVATSVLLAASPLLAGVTGRYFEDGNEAPSQPDPAPGRSGVAAYAIDEQLAGRLGRETEQQLELSR